MRIATRIPFARQRWTAMGFPFTREMLTGVVPMMAFFERERVAMLSPSPHSFLEEEFSTKYVIL